VRAAAPLLILAGCASINPTLAPARALAPGAIAAELGSGYAAPVVDSSLAASGIAAQHASTGSVSDADREALQRAALAWGMTPAGLAPYAAMRAGVGAQTEGQIAWVGRMVRLGVRHAFVADDVWAFSLGVQARGALWSDPFGSAVPLLSVQGSRVLGGDVTAVLGRTSARLYDLWLGLRAGYTRGDATLQFGTPAINGGNEFGASVDRLDVGATVGLRVGFGHLAALVEIEAAFGFFDGRLAAGVDMGGWSFTLVPAAALSWSF
jgi:hypothetical protein